ncbi:TPA: AAA family ATPase, partial [Enterococcus faecium]|nr:AAA family ATPase [Enterococcus faecium]
MFISTLQIRNFRNYESEIFRFDNETNTIIGENDSGKTNALTALRILLDDSYYYSSKTLKESDFFHGIQNGWQGHWIIISATFEGISEEEFDNEICASISLNSESQTILEELISNADKGVGSISLFIRPNKAIRKQLFDISTELDSHQFNEFRNSIRLSDYEFYYTSKSNLNFCINENYDKLVGRLNDNIASNPEEDDEALLGSRIDMSDIFKHISVVYVDALRDVLREMKNNRNPVKRIMETIESKISSDNVESLKTIIQQLNETITSVPEIRKIGENINRQLNSIIGSVYSPNLLLSSTMSDDMGSLAKFLSMKPEQNIDLDLLGLGHLNMIYLALKIVEFEACRSRELLNIMLIEEPEAHIHHHIQKTLFEGLNLQKNYTQILMTTHSVHLAEVSEISRMNVLKSFNGKSIVMNPANNLNSFAKEKLKKNNLNLINAVERYLDVKRNGLLFSKGVILVEGDAEEILIPQIVKKLFGINLDELGIGLINVGSTSFEYIASLFDDDRIQRKCAIVTDLDEQAIPSEHRLYKSTAQEKGQARKEKLSSLFNENNWVNCFYANTTFEIEFLDVNKENILTYVSPIIDDAFKDKKTITAYKEEIQSEQYLERNLAML